MRSIADTFVLGLGYALAGAQVGGPVFVVTMFFLPWYWAAATGLTAGIWYARFVDRAVDRRNVEHAQGDSLKE